MTNVNTFSVATDGWNDGAEAPIEPPDTAAFGWLNYADSDEIVPPSTAVTGNSPQPMWYQNVVKQ